MPGRCGFSGLTPEKTACYSPIVPSLHVVPPDSLPLIGARGSRATPGGLFPPVR